MAGFMDFLGSFFGGGGPEQLAGPGMEAASAGTGGGGAGFWDTLSSAGSSIGGLAKAALPIAQLGTTGLGIYGGVKQQQRGAEQMEILKQQQRQQQQMAAPAAQAGGALTQAGQAALLGGALPPALEAQVEQFKNDARMRLRQQLAATGQTDSSAMLQYEAWIESQAQQLRGQLAGNLYGQGLSGIQTGLGPSTAVSQSALGIAGGTQGSLEAANKALAQLLGSA